MWLFRVLILHKRFSENPHRGLRSGRFGYSFLHQISSGNPQRAAIWPPRVFILVGYVPRNGVMCRLCAVEKFSTRQGLCPEILLMCQLCANLSDRFCCRVWENCYVRGYVPLMCQTVKM